MRRMRYKWTLSAGGRAWLWHLYVVFITVATGLVLAWLSNKLLVDEAVKRAMSRIYAPLLSLNYSQAGQREITVLTVDDEDLKDYGLNWPVPLDFYQRVLDRVVKHQPKAFFLDVLFLDDKPAVEIDSLIGAACRSTTSGIPFYLATFALESLSSNAERRIFEAKTSTGVPCVVPVRPNVTPDSIDQSQWAYPLRPRTDAERASPTPLPDSVALTIYCGLYAATCPGRVDVPLSLIWATEAASTNVDTMVTRGDKGPLKPICRGVWNWWEVIPGANWLLTIADHPALPLCPYNQVIPVRAFKGQGFSEKELHDALAGKIVLLGVDLKAVGDNAFSPVHGRLPGVHVHAMALDNLISFNGVYREDGEFEWRELWHTSANLFIFLSVLLTAIVMLLWKNHKERLVTKCLPTEICSKTPSSDWSILLWLRRCRSIHSDSWLISKLALCGLICFHIVMRLAMIFLLPLFLGLGWPRFGSTKKSRQELRQSLIELVIYFVLCINIFYLGYYVFRQGPLSIIEYVLFPIMAHYLHWGERVARRSKQFWQAMTALNPFKEWARLNFDPNSRH